MSNVMRLCLVCYRASLWLYPLELRRSYGGEMIAAFAQMLAAESAAHGLRGIAASGCRAITEIFTVAIPGHIHSDWVITAILLLGTNLGVLLLEDLFFVRRVP
jgi:hypothetical protein